MSYLKGSIRPAQRTVLWVLAVFLSLTPMAVAGDESAALKQAINLYNAREYLAAQEKLVGIDRSKLDTAEQSLRDEYLNRIQVAITMYEKALRDLEDAETAISEKENDEAERLLQSVLTNEYAAEALKRSARAHLRDLHAAEAKPTVKQPVEPVAPPPSPQAEPQVPAAQPEGEAPEKVVPSPEKKATPPPAEQPEEHKPTEPVPSPQVKPQVPAAQPEGETPEKVVPSPEKKATPPPTEQPEERKPTEPVPSPQAKPQEPAAQPEGEAPEKVVPLPEKEATPPPAEQPEEHKPTEPVPSPQAEPQEPAAQPEEEKPIEPSPTPEVGEPEEATPPPAQQVEPETVPQAGVVNAQRARVLTQEANDMVRAGRFDEAGRRYQEALQAVPGYPEAVAGLQRVAEHERNVSGTRGGSLIERIQRQNLINWQRTVTEYRELEESIRNQVSHEHFDKARQLLVRVHQIVESGKQYAVPLSAYEELRTDLETLERFVPAQERAYNERKVAEITRDIEQQRERRLRETAQRRARQVEALMSQAEQHRKDGNLDAAINVLQQVTVIDPKYRPARWRMDDLEDLRQYRAGRKIRHQFYEQTRRSLNEVEEAKIPWADQLRYPKNWPELITRPDRQRPDTIRRNSQLFGALDSRIPVDFQHTPFDEAVEKLADTQHINVIVNWNDLQRAGIDRTVPIDLSLPREVTLKKALTEVLEQAGGGIVDLGYDLADGAVKIATQQFLDKKTYTAIYDINDLLFEVPMFNNSPVTDLTQVNRQASRKQTQQADLPWRYGDDDDDEPEEDPERATRVQKLIGLIEESVAKDSWFDRGGSIGNIREFNGQLVITQNSAAHGQIADLLGQLRAQRAVQIAVEARFITVTSNYLEELGFDIDFVLNSGNAGLDFVPTGSGPLRDPVLGNTLLLPRTFSRLGFTPNPPALGQALAPNPAGGLAQPFGQTQLVPQRRGGGGSRATPVPIINQVSVFTDPSTLGSDIPGSFAGNTLGSAFSLFGSFLDNIQVDFLIRATQADSRSTVLTSPQLVLFNGQRSFVAVTIQQNFVSQLNPVVATGAVAQAPVTQVINSGAVLDVEATVTADKRYVTMTIRPSVTRLLNLQTIPFSGGSGTGGAALTAFVQLPTLSIQAVQTTVSVPDGGTLLIGGQKLASETEVEAGVPILSKIPILKRLYSSRSTVKDEQTLLILVKPRILIQTEQEEQAFPSFSRG